MFRKTAMAGLLCLLMLPVFSQLTVDFEDLNLPADSFWNGSDMSGGFYSLNNKYFFKNNFTDWGGGITSWDGFAYSNRNDDSTQAFSNMFSNYSGNNSNNLFALSYLSSDWMNYVIIPNFIQFDECNSPYSIQITNSTYTALTMLNGDAFSKKFGGISGDDPDWFKLSIFGYSMGYPTDTVEFYLADYRFPDNNDDYIIKEWTTVDISSLYNIDSLGFSLSSSDTGAYGMNTPAIFCFDNLITDICEGSEQIENDELLIYPNPATDFVIIPDYSGEIVVSGMDGKILINENINERLDISSLPEGMYIIQAGKKRTLISKL